MSAIDDVKKLTADYDAAHQIGDGKAIARMYCDDAVIIPPGKSAITGREAIDKFFSGVKGGAGLKSELARMEVDGSLAYDYGKASWTENGDRKVLYYMDIYCLIDGVWKIQLSSWNSNEGISD
jgi:ketosteroid isomerase-like protein